MSLNCTKRLDSTKSGDSSAAMLQRNPLTRTVAVVQTIVFFGVYSSVLEYIIIAILNVRTGEQVIYCHDSSIPFLLVSTVNGEHRTRD